MKTAILCLTVVSIALLLTGCAASQSQTQAPAGTEESDYFRVLTLENETFRLGDTSVKPPTLWKSQSPGQPFASPKNDGRHS